MNYIEVTPDEQQELLKRIEVIQKEQLERFHKNRRIVKQWESKVIPWYYRIYMTLSCNHKYRKEEDEYQMAWFILGFSCNSMAFNETRLDIINAHGKNIWMPCETYRKIMEEK